jgi:hypothetical protein
MTRGRSDRVNPNERQSNPPKCGKHSASLPELTAVVYVFVLQAMIRLAVARAVSIAGHPVVILPAAVLLVASTRGASLRQLWLIGVAFATIGAVVIGFSWFQVRSGRWSHVDASARTERSSLNVFLAAIFASVASVLWYVTRTPSLTLGFALAAALVLTALLLLKWVKVSLHVASAAFATAFLWPNRLALVAGVVVTAALVWSRLVLRRHVAADIATGLLLGAAAGSAYHMLVL